LRTIVFNLEKLTMKDRILKFLTSERLSPAKFADDIGVQRSSISHILSGRNNPSFDFIQKMLQKYPQLNAEWLVIGRGEMYKSLLSQGNLFDQPKREEKAVKNTPPVQTVSEPFSVQNSGQLPGQDSNIEASRSKKNKVIERVLIFYSDHTLDEYKPEN
jgi:transcriptional regulator with XRE-family HTH domain